MNLTSIRLQNFKNCKDREIVLNGKNAVISGANGTGKSTLLDGYLVALCDCDSKMVNNPPIIPLGSEEVMPIITLTFDCDGRPLEFKRIIKRTVKHREGDSDLISLSSTYEVNGVSYGLRDMKIKLDEYGIDTSKYLALVHPDCFTSSKKDEMRKILFSMASGKTDLEVAQLTEGAEKVAEMLVNYKVEEIEAMAKNSIKKVKDEYGANGEILNAKIQGLEMSKIEVDLSSLELAKNTEAEEISKIKSEIETANSNDELANAKARQTELCNKMSSMVVNNKRDFDAKVNEARRNYDFENLALEGIKTKKSNSETMLNFSKKQFDSAKSEFTELKATLEKLKEETFDDSNLECPTCGQTYPESKQNIIKAEWNKNHEKAISDIQAKMDNANHSGKDAKKAIDTYEAEVKQYSDEIEKKISDMSPMSEAIKNMSPDDVTITDEYKALNGELSALMGTISSLEAKKANISVLKANLSVHEEALMNIERQLSSVNHNERVDNQIEELRGQQLVYEQTKANAEKILYQLELVSKKKNELLTNEINSHFDLVNWKFFAYQKNGGYKESCDCFVDGKLLGIDTNTGLSLLAKLDIIKGLQRFYNVSYPVFIDNAECLSAESFAKIDLPNQWIALKVTEDKDLNVEVK